MNIWKCTNWDINGSLLNVRVRKGIRFRFQPDVDNNVRRACIDFSNWLRREFVFPIRVVIYIKGTPFIRASDGDNVTATFFEPISKLVEPYIRIATGDYQQLVNKIGKDNALAAILRSIAHELTHYYQWLNDIQLSDI